MELKNENYTKGLSLKRNLFGQLVSCQWVNKTHLTALPFQATELFITQHVYY